MAGSGRACESTRYAVRCHVFYLLSIFHQEGRIFRKCLVFSCFVKQPEPPIQKKLENLCHRPPPRATSRHTLRHVEPGTKKGGSARTLPPSPFRASPALHRLADLSAWSARRRRRPGRARHAAPGFRAARSAYAARPVRSTADSATVTGSDCSGRAIAATWRRFLRCASGRRASTLAPGPTMPRYRSRSCSRKRRSGFAMNHPHANA